MLLSVAGCFGVSLSCAKEVIASNKTGHNIHFFIAVSCPAAEKLHWTFDFIAETPSSVNAARSLLGWGSAMQALVPSSLFYCLR
jgi:hypothetical protein